MTTARLAIIYRHLGETDLADQYLKQAIAYARQGAQEEGDKSWLGRTDEQTGTLLLDFVNKLTQRMRARNGRGSAPMRLEMHAIEGAERRAGKPTPTCQYWMDYRRVGG
jgi:hypothetical protein